MRPISLVTLVAVSVVLASTVSTTRGQALPDGYATQRLALPNGTGQVLVLGSQVAHFDGKDLVLTGSSSRKLLSFAASTFGSFAIAVGSDALLFGESNATGSSSGIWLVPTTGSAVAKKLTSMKFNYAATLYGTNHAIVSAKTGGFSAKNNDIIAVDLTTGARDTIAIVPGNSGPVVADRYGNLYYATSSTTVDIVRFSATQVRAAFGPTHLSIKDAAVVHRNLPAAGQMVIDDDHDAFVTDWKNNRILEINDILGPAPRRSILASYSGTPMSVNGLQFVAGDRKTFAVQELEPFQPTGGGELWIHATSYSSGKSELTRVAAARPVTSIDTTNPVPARQAFKAFVTNGPRGGSGILALGLGANSREVVYRLGFEAPQFWASSLLAPILLQPVSFDSKGMAQLPLYNPGVATPLTLTVQGHCIAAGPHPAAGSSDPLVLTVR